MLVRETVETGTAQAILPFTYEAERNGQLAKRFLISLNGRKSRHQIAFAVCRAPGIKLSVNDGRSEWSNRPVCQMPHRLHVVVTVDHNSVGSAAALTIDNGITRAHLERTSSDAHPLHHLFDCFSHCLHPGTASCDRWHTTEGLQALSKTPSMAVDVTIEAGKAHD